ncbi:MAG: hypothetical protein WKG07_21490 [Hymenobacter sp.]
MPTATSREAYVTFHAAYPLDCGRQLLLGCNRDKATEAGTQGMNAAADAAAADAKANPTIDNPNVASDTEAPNPNAPVMTFRRKPVRLW